jgi:hypothetical protein
MTLINNTPEPTEEAPMLDIKDVDVNEQVRTTNTETEESEIEALAKEFRMKGLSDEEADKKAREQYKKDDALAEQQWQDFIKKIRLYDILDDLMRRAIVAYKDNYNKNREVGDHIDFKLLLNKGRTHGKGAIFVVDLVFEIKRKGLWKTYNKKQLQFHHVKDIRNEAGWKFALYEAMFQGLLFNGITYMLSVEDARELTKQ